MTEKIQFRGRRAIGWVDALRILACFMVVLAHAATVSWLSSTVIRRLFMPE